MATTDKPTVTLYWLEQSRSHRILWLLEELNAPYELKTYHRDPKTHLAPPELKEVHPLGKSPVISVVPAGAGPEQKPVVIAESALIVEWILDNYGKDSGLIPKQWQEGKEGVIGYETEEYRRYRYFMHYAEGSLMTLLLLGMFNGRIKDAPVPFFIKPVTRMISGNIESSYIGPNKKSHFDFIESQLASAPNGGGYLCGNKLLGADILMSFPLIGAREGGYLPKEQYPKILAYVEKLEAEPGYKKAVQKIVEIEGKFEAML